VNVIPPPVTLLNADEVKKRMRGDVGGATRSTVFI
jgi:hypothetical protein